MGSRERSVKVGVKTVREDVHFVRGVEQVARSGRASGHIDGPCGLVGVVMLIVPLGGHPRESLQVPDCHEGE